MTTTDPDQRPLAAAPAHPAHPGYPAGRTVPGLPVRPRVGEDFGLTVARTAVLAPAARLVTAAAGAALVWLTGTGFVTHRFGETSFTSSDRGRLPVVGLAAAVAWMARRRVVTVARREQGGE